MRALSKEQFARYAQQQIEMADQMLSGHLPGQGGWCSCGKQLPCSVVEHAMATKQHLHAKLALLETTAVLPVLPSAAKAKPVQLWRRLLGGGL